MIDPHSLTSIQALRDYLYHADPGRYLPTKLTKNQLQAMVAKQANDMQPGCDGIHALDVPRNRTTRTRFSSDANILPAITSSECPSHKREEAPQANHSRTKRARIDQLARVIPDLKNPLQRRHRKMAVRSRVVEPVVVQNEDPLHLFQDPDTFQETPESSLLGLVLVPDPIPTTPRSPPAKFWDHDPTQDTETACVSATPNRVVPSKPKVPVHPVSCLCQEKIQSIEQQIHCLPKRLMEVLEDFMLRPKMALGVNKCVQTDPVLDHVTNHTGETDDDPLIPNGADEPAQTGVECAGHIEPHRDQCTDKDAEEIDDVLADHASDVAPLHDEFTEALEMARMVLFPRSSLQGDLPVQQQMIPTPHAVLTESGSCGQLTLSVCSNPPPGVPDPDKCVNAEDPPSATPPGVPDPDKCVNAEDPPSATA